MKTNEDFMREAIELARNNVAKGTGGPFGAIVVKNGEIIGRGANSVTATNDPTAHAEVMAIRDACRHLNTFQLTDCEIYTSCEPCPMCMAAIYWARPAKVYYGATKTDAARAGFDDDFIYRELSLDVAHRHIRMHNALHTEAQQPFDDWLEAGNKIEY